MYSGLEDFELADFDENIDDASGRAYEKSQFMAALVNEDFDGIIGMANCSNFFLTGPAGSGKSYLARCFAQTAKEEDYEVYHIDCEDIMTEEDPGEVWKEIFADVIRKSDVDGDYDQKIFLYLENLDAVKENRKSVRVISAALKEIANVDCKCIIVSTDITGSSVPTTILKQFSIIELDKPDEDARKDYFKSLLKIKWENPDNEKEVIVFYPLALGAEEKKEDDKDYDELSVLALYCAEKTEGLTFGQLQIVLNQLNRQLKRTLQRITDNDVSAIGAHVKYGKGYVVTEEEFLEIVAKIRNGAKVLEQAERFEQGRGNIPAMAQPQVVYAQPMMMSNMQMSNMQMVGGYPMAGGYGTPATPDDARINFLKQVADDANPEVAALQTAFDIAQTSINTDQSGMEGFV